MEEKRSERDEVREKRLDKDVFFLFIKNKSYIISKSYLYKKLKTYYITSIRIYKPYIGDYLYFLHFLYIYIYIYVFEEEEEEEEC